jgi:hypothetical protein
MPPPTARKTPSQKTTIFRLMQRTDPEAVAGVGVGNNFREHCSDGDFQYFTRRAFGQAAKLILRAIAHLST